MARESFSDLIKAQTERQGPKCITGQVLSKLSDDERREVIEALQNPDIPGSAITRALKVWGHDIGASSIYRHRRKECSCDVG